MKRFFKRFMAFTLAGILMLAPLTVSAAELKTTKYNPDVTTSSGKLKPGYRESKDSSKTWWKTETYYTDWKEVDKATFDAVTDKDLKMMATSTTPEWKTVDRDTYEKVLKENPDYARTNGYTDYKSCDKATYDAASDELRSSKYSDWKVVDKNTYDQVQDPNLKYAEQSDWQLFADTNNWASKYDEWLKYPEDLRRAYAGTDFYEVSQSEYQEFASKFPGYEGVLYKYEDGAYKTYKLADYPYFDEQVIADIYHTNGGHDPFYVLVGELTGSNYMAEGGTFDGNNDGVRYFNDSNGGSAVNIAEGTLSALQAKGVPYVSVSSSSDIPNGVGPNKFNQHVNDPNRNAGGGGNSFIDIVDEDFKIYYYSGTGTISVNGLYGIIIAPYGTVEINGKWIGTVIAGKVINNGAESAKWTYPPDKGEIERKFYITAPCLEVKDDVYMVRTVEYFVRDLIYQVCDMKYKYCIRSLEDKVYYCEKSPYVPQTGDTTVRFLSAMMAVIITVGCLFIVVSRKKDREV